jgi:hypothetical protein
MVSCSNFMQPKHTHAYSNTYCQSNTVLCAGQHFWKVNAFYCLLTSSYACGVRQLHIFSFTFQHSVHDCKIFISIYSGILLKLQGIVYIHRSLVHYLYRSVYISHSALFWIYTEVFWSENYSPWLMEQCNDFVFVLNLSLFVPSCLYHLTSLCLLNQVGPVAL